MARGIECTEIFRNSDDQNDFINRLTEPCQKGDMIIYAWALMPNHFHLLIRTGKKPLSASMRKILTGYVVNFNRRYARSGHLFQNRYKSIICEDDPYLLELTRYIHLNPLRANLIKSLKELNRYPFTGHSAITGAIRREWQEIPTILAYFGRKRSEAIDKYKEFIRQGLADNEKSKFGGGGLLRSLGGWSEVIALRHKGKKPAGDERILGQSEFVDKVIKEAEVFHKEALRLNQKALDLTKLAKAVEKITGISEEELVSGSKRKMVVEARKLLIQVAVGRMKDSGAKVARYLGVTTSAVNRMARYKEVPEVERVMKLFYC
jgi:REP element-mobilizing transposase RayT